MRSLLVIVIALFSDSYGGTYGRIIIIICRLRCLEGFGRSIGGGGCLMGRQIVLDLLGRFLGMRSQLSLRLKIITTILFFIVFRRGKSINRQLHLKIKAIFKEKQTNRVPRDPIRA